MNASSHHQSLLTSLSSLLRFLRSNISKAINASKPVPIQRPKRILSPVPGVGVFGWVGGVGGVGVDDVGGFSGGVEENSCGVEEDSFGVEDDSGGVEEDSDGVGGLLGEYLGFATTS